MWYQSRSAYQREEKMHSRAQVYGYERGAVEEDPFPLGPAAAPSPTGEREDRASSPWEEDGNLGGEGL